MPIHTLLTWLAKQVNRVFQALLRPASAAPLVNTLLDLSRPKPDLIAENALLGHQLALLMRQSKPPRLKSADCLRLLMLARVTKTWRQVLLIVQPATLLRWHREGFRLFMRFKQHQPKRQTRFSAEIIALIRQMACENPLWGAERIRGELLKLGFKVAKRIVQRYMNPCPTLHTSGQAWATFLKTHVNDIWACDFVPVIDLFFQQLFVFFIIELHSRQVIHFNVTRHPNDVWVARQLQAPRPTQRNPSSSPETMIKSLAMPLMEWPNNRGLKSCERPFARRRQMRSASVSSAACDESV